MKGAARCASAGAALVLAACGAKPGLDRAQDAELLATAPSGKSSIFVRKSRDAEMVGTELLLAKDRGHLPGKAIDLPDDIGLSQSPPHKLSFTWSKDERRIIMVAGWRYNDTVFFCDQSVQPLGFKELKEPDWPVVISGEERKPQFEWTGFKYYVDSASFAGDDEVRLKYRVSQGEKESSYEFNYRFGKDASTGPVLVR